jgi:hypothetical protein
MKTNAHDFVTVDMRGLKAALVARAQAERIAVSVLVRRSVERELGVIGAAAVSHVQARSATSHGPIVKLSIRVTRVEAERLDSAARAAGLSRAAFLAGLLANVPCVAGGSAGRLDCLAALNASCAELSTLSRNLYQLTSLLRQAQVRPAMEYRRMLDTLGDDVRAHLRLAASALAALRPARRAPAIAAARSYHTAA